jgi:hypothetical protein
MRNRTNPDSLRNFLGQLNDVVTTALTAKYLDQIERERANARGHVRA